MQFKASAKDAQLFYSVQKYDHLIMVLRTFDLNPYNSKSGSIELLKKSNSFLAKRNKNIIRTKDKINFGSELSSRIQKIKSLGFISISDSNQVDFICNQAAVDKWMNYKKEKNPSLDPLDPKFPTLASRCHQDLKSNTNQRSLASEKSIESNGYSSSLDIGILLGYSSLKGENINSKRRTKLVSDVNHGLYINWHQKLSNDFATHIGFQIQKVNVTSATEIQIENKLNILGKLDLGVTYNFNDFNFDLNLGYSDKVLFRYINATTALAEATKVLNAELGLRYNLFQVKPLTIGLAVKIGQVLPYKIQAYDDPGSTYYESGFYFVHDNLKTSYIGGLDFRQNKFKPTSYLNYEENEIKLSLGVRFDLGQQSQSLIKSNEVLK